MCRQKGECCVTDEQVQEAALFWQKYPSTPGHQVDRSMPHSTTNIVFEWSSNKGLSQEQHSCIVNRITESMADED